MLRSPPRYSSPNLPPLDDADRRIIDCLIKDGRASGRDLSQHTGLSEANVSRRLARLLEERSVRVLGFVPPAHLGLHVQFVTYLRINGCVETATTELLKHPEFAYVQSVFGRWDLVIFGVVESTGAMVDLLDRTVVQHPNVHEAETCVTLEFHGGSPIHAPAGPGRELDPIDRLIIREVQADGRISFTDIAANVGISPTSAADRFRKLSADGIIRIAALPDPARVGMHLSGLLQLAVDRSARKVAEELRRIPELSFVSIKSGNLPVECEFQVRDGQHYDTLREQVLALPGVHDLHAMVHRKLYRQSFQWCCQGLPATARPADAAR